MVIWNINPECKNTRFPIKNGLHSQKEKGKLSTYSYLFLNIYAANERNGRKGRKIIIQKEEKRLYQMNN